MRDRIPGAPGQYKAVIAENQLAAMQAGEQFVITLVRDDQPVVEGTPYNKESVLPEELAQALCPDIDDPTLADALAALLPKSGGAMTGSMSMGGEAIRDVGWLGVGDLSVNGTLSCMSSRLNFINGTRIRAHNFEEDNIPFVLDKGGHCAYLVVGKTNSGVCVYALGIDQGGVAVEAIKICGGEYANFEFTADVNTLTIHGSRYAVCYVISIDNWNF
jgi:hypothetical protein